MGILNIGVLDMQLEYFLMQYESALDANGHSVIC